MCLCLEKVLVGELKAHIDTDKHPKHCMGREFNECKVDRVSSSFDPGTRDGEKNNYEEEN